MPLLWEWVSYKTDCANYIKVLAVTFIVGAANLDLRREFMFQFKTLQLRKASAVEMNCMKSRLADGVRNVLASRDSCILLQLVVSLLSSPGSVRVTLDHPHQVVGGLILCSSSLIRALVL